ncbi:Hypothetical predicted protein, partial [Paramuricea clavata]
MEASKIASLISIALIIKRRRKRRRRSLWTREWLKRNERGVFRQLMEELRLEDPEHYRRYLRMDTSKFECLLEKVEMKLTRKDTNMREAIPAGERLALSLRFLATGESYSSLHYQFRISVSSFALIVPEVCQAVFDVMKDEFLHFPENEEEWLAIAAGFEDVWQLPHCIGAADGKHVRILHPRNSGSVFYNYK